jgi:GMP synthase (glutamine-hydrolysing)
VHSPLLILKTGDTLPAVSERHGDFERWFIETLGTPERFRVVDLPRGALPGDPGDFSGIVITGSPSSMTVPEDWYETGLDFLRRALAADVPMLGVCFGHQMLAVATGGRVERNPRGREIGTVEVELSAEGTRDPLFAGLGPRFAVNATHVDAVTELPPGAVLLAGNEACPVQAFALGPCVRAVQWHPEFGRDIIRGYIESRAALLREEGSVPERLLQVAADTPSGARILRNFELRFVHGRSSG